jgi:ABC-2 type transport system ATP-binding protein
VIAGAFVVEVDGDASTREVLKSAIELGANVESVTPKRETLESLFVRRAL